MSAITPNPSATSPMRSKSPALKNLHMQDAHVRDNSIKAKGYKRLGVSNSGMVVAQGKSSRIIGRLPWYRHCDGRAASRRICDWHNRTRWNILYSLYRRKVSTEGHVRRQWLGAVFGIYFGCWHSSNWHIWSVPGRPFQHDFGQRCSRDD